ncbi:MAG: DUF1028 domain-containing protein [Bradyrhizobium sp.]|uniref:DUF1028 domain-containing protein n=1 Tax=Bradyrhizobium sp. TaxID=376 RepID=UPI001E1834AB|nr:DUF1028 domain-containing protein [Bradyrhizobium sp.]MBV9559139.1 DUF1028 domain-containing protein [Bradyrhizobium sp.]
MLEMNTFSIAARCARSGMFGVAVSTAVPGVGGICPWVKSGVGAVATQSWVNPCLGIDGLKLLAEGKSAQQALDALIAADPGREVRQLGLVDSSGASAAFSGSQCTQWYGHRTGPNFAVQGNMLVGEPTVAAMAEAFARTDALPLAERLVIVLEAGQAAGGDKRGRQSAAILVHHSQDYPYLSLRVDEHAHPVAELRRVFEVARCQLIPFIDGMPTRENPIGNLPKSITDMLMVPPPFRPGGGGAGL